MSELTQKDIRKIKQIRGRTVNHPFSAPNIFYAFFTLLLVALPLGIFFTPLLQMPVEGVLFEVNGLQLVKYLLVHPLQEPTIQMLVFVNLATSATVTEQILMIFYIVQSALIMVLILHAVIALILFIVNITKGYLVHSGLTRGLAVSDFVFALIFSLTFLVDYIFTTFTGNSNMVIPWYSFIAVGSSLIILIVLASIYVNHFKDAIFEKDLEYHSDAENEVVTHVTEVHEVTKVNYEPANVLPNNITSIGGHAFAENQHLIVANIPMGISKIGASAFANCLNLKVASIPLDVKEIGFNCFFNCVSLERLNYAGTKEQWRHVKRGSNWLARAKTTQVICVDGAIVVNPYH